jgi:hypothetical protein
MQSITGGAGKDEIVRDGLPRMGGPVQPGGNIPSIGNEGIRAEGPHEIGPKDIFPGYNYPTIPPMAIPTPDHIVGSLESIESAASETEDKLLQSAAVKLDAIEATVADITNKLNGRIGNIDIEIGKIEDKLSSKLSRNADRQLNEIYAIGTAVGMGRPSLEEIAGEQLLLRPQVGYIPPPAAEVNVPYSGSPPVAPIAPPLPTIIPGTIPARPAVPFLPGVPLPGLATPPPNTGGIPGFPCDPATNSCCSPEQQATPECHPQLTPPVQPAPQPSGVCVGIVELHDTGGVVPQLAATWGDQGEPSPYDPTSIVAPFTTPNSGEPAGSYVQWQAAVLNPGGSIGQADLTFILPAGYYPHWDANGQIYGIADASGGATGFSMCQSYDSTAVPPAAETPPVAGQCPIPKPLDCPAPPWPELNPIIDAERCSAELDRLVTSFNNNFKVSDFFKIGTTTAGPLDVAQKKVLDFLGVPSVRIGDLLGSVGSWIDKTIKSQLQTVSCDQGQLAPIAIIQAICGFSERWLGLKVTPIQNNIETAMNWSCQSLLPTVSEANAAFMANKISQKEWECWTKANGSYVPQAELVRDSGRNRPNVQEWMTLLRRGRVDPKTADAEIRAQGVISDTDKFAFNALLDATPQLDDIIRMMVRDVSDDVRVNNPVEVGKLDEDFENKWQGQVEKWGNALGITKDVARYYWRAHWQLPSPTQGYEMLHRLRPGRVDVDLVFDENDMRRLLKDADFAPGYIDKMIAVSYPPITLTDAAKAFSYRSISDEEFVEVLQDEGRSKQNADQIFNYYARLRRRQELSRAGLGTPKFPAEQYARGEIDQDEFERILDLMGLPDETKAAALEYAEHKLKVFHRKQLIACTKSRFNVGDIAEDEAVNLLIAGDMPHALAGRVVREWCSARRRKNKLATAERLCRWRELGLISEAVQVLMLSRIGWEPADARRIAAECEAGIVARLTKKQEAADAKRQKAADKAAANLAKFIKEQEKKAEEAAKSAEQRAGQTTGGNQGK